MVQPLCIMPWEEKEQLSSWLSVTYFRARWVTDIWVIDLGTWMLTSWREGGQRTERTDEKGREKQRLLWALTDFRHAYLQFRGLHSLHLMYGKVFWQFNCITQTAALFHDCLFVPWQQRLLLPVETLHYKNSEKGITFFKLNNFCWWSNEKFLFAPIFFLTRTSLVNTHYIHYRCDHQDWQRNFFLFIFFFRTKWGE